MFNNQIHPKKMKKYLVETYYTCTFKTVHSLDELNENQCPKLIIEMMVLWRLLR